MIIIIRALPQWGKDDGDYDSPTSRDETPAFMKNKRGQRSPNKKRGQRSPQKNKKKREKERRGNVTIFLPHLCFKVAPCSSYRESHMLSLSYTSGNFPYRTWLVYSNDGLPQKCPRSLWASKLDSHPLSFFLSFHTLIALVHPLHGNPYSLTLISINGHLYSPLICLVNVRLSSPFCLLHNHHSISPIVLYPWLALMYCVKVEKVWDY